MGSIGRRRDTKIVYPYFDQGLGIEVRSPGHRKRVMREMGLEEIGGDLDAFYKALDEERKAKPLTTPDEVAVTLKSIRTRMANDGYRAYYEGRMTEAQRENFEQYWFERFGERLRH